jgi:nicotinate-nucleotide adenylyltransferase
MRIGFYGGSFDPPHRAHLVVAQAARDRLGLERVLLAPTGRQPLKPEGPSASFADRLRMTELLCAGESRLQASAIEAPSPNGAPNYTADTLRRLRSKLTSDAELFAIVGADAFRGIRQWREFAELFKLAEWVVVSRPGIPEGDQAFSLGPEQRARVHILGGVEEPVSATEVRHRLVAGLPCDDLLTPPVLAYIRAHGLYRNGHGAAA